MDFRRSRLTLLREMEGLTKEQFASMCGVTRRAVTDWESGKVESPPVHDIATRFDVPSEFFYGEELEEVSAEIVSFRALSTMTARQSKRVLASATLAIQLSYWIDDRYTTPPVDLPVLDDLAPQFSFTDPGPSQASEILRSYWSLGNAPVENMMKILERHGVRILSLPPTSREVDAFSFWREDRPFIFLNVDKSAERLRFDLAHELGHLFMHRNVVTVREKAYEHDANSFAASFLLPADGVFAHAATASRDLRLDDVLVLKTSWKVSAMAMVRRLNDLCLINDWQYRNWIVELSKKGYRKSEPNGIPAEMSTLLKEILELARQDGHSLDAISASLGIPKRQVAFAIAGLAVISLDGGGVTTRGRPTGTGTYLKQVR